MINLKERDILKTYDILTGNFADGSLFLNMGYWRDRPSSMNEACEALANLLAETANFNRDDEILDVGFGLGRQDTYWMKNFTPQKIVGLNISSSQVEKAQKHVFEEGMEEQIDLRIGSATDMDLKTESFSKVVALESAVHFMPRDDFFREAHRVLKPGGKLVTSDIIFAQEQRGFIEKNVARQILYNLDVPKENHYSSDEYVRRLEDVGFENVKVKSIREDVYLPYCKYITKSFFKGKVNWNLKLDYKQFLSFNSESLDYRLAFMRRFASYLLVISGMVPFWSKLMPKLTDSCFPDYIIVVADKK